ncbi:M23 family metallopeptidase [Planosporangium flavigriseum]|uniref:M23 family metallopeptidase n=1 Tax=Planosporangium flavigriseum TaxID=373681 RepID=UPI00143A5F49|nr:M23 family metallopeptidase [Planosporangium flavigriseum]NJC64118.1 M23 family metallopeptidase [Planosporangium flavigriseum]
MSLTSSGRTSSGRPTASRSGRYASLLLAAATVIGASAGVRPALAAPDPAPAQPTVGVGFRWPLSGPAPTARRFEPPPQPWLPGHRGIDLAASPGAPVYAAGPGVVRFAGRLAGRGVVSIDHSDGLRTTYEPITPTVVAGRAVRAGDVIGTLDPAHPGCPVAACLHWGLRRDEVYLDPLALVGRARVRLLPLAPAAS